MTEKDMQFFQLKKLNERGQRRKKSEHVEKEKVGRIRKD